ncbi:hypothetical protein RJT34_04200 [Clitoria ternatea]|uniref:Uncharacterized protein n=1 Tax=Clitoria ternatea TaxID=43366 RepID=A0AAN9KPA6_CLITE
MKEDVVTIGERKVEKKMAMVKEGNGVYGLSGLDIGPKGKRQFQPSWKPIGYVVLTLTLAIILLEYSLSFIHSSNLSVGESSQVTPPVTHSNARGRCEGSPGQQGRLPNTERPDHRDRIRSAGL